MDLDSNDLLSTNIYIPEPEYKDSLSNQQNQEFRNYYKEKVYNKNIRDIQEKIDLRNTHLNEDTDQFNLLNSNSLKLTEPSNSINITNTRFKKEIKTLISIDSRDRDKTKYPLASHFIIDLGKTYYNIKEVRLASIEFPNTNAVINTNNDMVYWINQQDILLDTINSVTKTYPVYSAEMRTGSYVASSLQTELTNELSLIKRGDDITFHYFVVTLDLDTDVVTFISLILQTLPVNPLTTVGNTGIITVNAPNHGFTNGESVYILGTSLTAGISSSTLNGFHTITVINNDLFQYEVNINATETLTGGGNVVQVGTSAPFQFKFGEYNKTIAQNIGYPLENSSTLINTSIQSINNFYQIQITTTQIAMSTNFNYINQNVILQNTTAFLSNGNSGIGNSLNGVYLISNVLNSTDFLISSNSPLYQTIYVTQTENDLGSGSIVNNPSFISSYIFSISTGSTNSIILPPLQLQNDHYYTGWWIKFINGNCINQTRLITSYTQSTNTITLNTPFTNSPSVNDVFYIYSAPTFVFNSNVYTITTIQNYNINTVLFTFFTPHNYTFSQISSTIDFYNTTSIPNFNGSNIILGIPSPTSIYIAGQVLTNGSVSTTTPGNIGTTPEYNVLTPLIYNISSVVPGQSGYTTIYTTTNHILSIGDSIQISGLSITPPFTNGGIFKIYTIPTANSFTIQYNSVLVDSTTYPTSYIGTDIITVNFPNHGFNSITSVSNINNTVTIVTLLPHYLSTGQLIRIMQTGISYIDNHSYIINVLSNDSFTINVTLPSGYVATSSTGILGMSNGFRLYNCQTVGGISPNFINNVPFNVNEILDENHFNFHLTNSYASNSTPTGTNIYISSFIHGFSGTQTNTKNNVLNRSINLEGENYSFLCCPQLATVLNTGSVNNIFARIILDQSPGNVVFNFLSNPKIFEQVPLEYLNTLELSILNYDGSFYIFNDLDYSFTLEITEIIDTNDHFNISSKRGIPDVKNTKN